MGFFDIFSSSGGKAAAGQQHKAQTRGLNQGFGIARDYNEKSIDALEEGRSDALGALKQGGQAHQGLYRRGVGGIDYYNQLLGGPGGDPQQMQQTLEGIPGYQFARDQGVQALDRQANAKGNPYNATDVLQFSQGLADQNYFSYLNALQPNFGLAQSGAGGIASNAVNQSNVHTNTASNIANAHSNMGNLGYNTQVGIGQAEGQLAQNRYAAEQGASGNMWNAILGGLGATASAAGTAGGFSKLLS